MASASDWANGGFSIADVAGAAGCGCCAIAALPCSATTSVATNPQALFRAYGRVTSTGPVVCSSHGIPPVV